MAILAQVPVLLKYNIARGGGYLTGLCQGPGYFPAGIFIDPRKSGTGYAHVSACFVVIHFIIIGPFEGLIFFVKQNYRRFALHRGPMRFVSLKMGWLQHPSLLSLSRHSFWANIMRIFPFQKFI